VCAGLASSYFYHLHRNNNRPANRNNNVGGLLRQANLALEVLRYQIRLAHDLQCL
jgi:hypothetical protein